MLGRYTYYEFITKKLFILCGLLVGFVSVQSQTLELTDSLNNELIVIDSTAVTLDTLSSDLLYPIFYDANDSIIFDARNNRVLLYGTAIIKYDDIELTSDFISYDFASSVVSAKGLPDSLGVLQGNPVFKQGSDTYKPDSMSFNFSNEKAYISNVVTQNGEFYLHSAHTKRRSTEKIYLGKTKITTCDKPNPHFHFHVKKAALVKNEKGSKIVSGPVVLKFRKIPTPLALPFGWFPNSAERSKGIIVPSYGNAESLGYFFRDFGYYYPISEYVDTRVLADVYTRGSWALKNVTAYKKKYRYNGRFNVTFSKIKNGFKELNNYSENTDFFVSWSHTLDSKARPNLRFSASVNAGTSSNFRNNFNSSQDNYLANTFSSSVSVTRSGLSFFNGKIPATLTASARHSQNTSTRIVSFTLPQLSFQTNRIYPFKSKQSKTRGALGQAVQGFGLTYTGNYENRATLREQDIRLNALGAVANDFNSGLRNQFSASTSIKAGVFSINPSLGFSSNIYRETLRLTYDQENLIAQEDTITGLDASYNWNASINATTKAFGTFTFRNGKNIKAIRHTITPSVGFRYRPKTGSREFGFFGDDGEAVSYDPQQIGIFNSATNYNNSGSVTFGLLNNLEMKVKGKESDDKPRKVPIIDRININTSRDFARDSINWSNLGISAGTRIGSKLNINYTSSYSFYDRNESGSQINTFLLDSENKLARLLNMGGGITATLRGTDFNKKDKEKDEKILDGPADDLADVPEEVREEIDLNRNDFVDFSVPWSANLTYTINRRNIFDSDLQRDTVAITQSILARGDLTIFEKWKIGYTTGYDLQAEKGNRLTPTTLSLFWDLHCWEFKFDYIPIGVRKSFTVQVNVKAAALKDLRIMHRGTFGNENGLR